MYQHDQAKLASRQSLIFQQENGVPAVCQIVCPVLGGALASKSVAAACVLMAVMAIRAMVAPLQAVRVPAVRIPAVRVPAPRGA
jgi:hypothetical protein